MITKPTVLVVGAGASVPYGFPTGKELTARIVTTLMDEGPHQGMNRCLERMAAKSRSTVDLTAFGERLKSSGLSSIDAFLQFEHNESLGPAAKAAVAWHIGQCEEEKKCGLVEENGDWLQYLFDMLVEGATTADALGQNRVTIVTFNFDRVIEARWKRVLSSIYPPSALPAAYASLPVIHVHGSPYGDTINLENLDSHPVGDPITDAIVFEAAERIYFIHDRAEPPPQALAALRSAQVVCFLGLSYADLNLKRLSLPDVLMRDPRAVQLYGTTLGLLAGEVRGVLRRLFVSRIPPVRPSESFPSVGCTEFLSLTDGLHA